MQHTELLNTIYLSTIYKYVPIVPNPVRMVYDHFVSYTYPIRPASERANGDVLAISLNVS